MGKGPGAQSGSLGLDGPLWGGPSDWDLCGWAGPDCPPGAAGSHQVCEHRPELCLAMQGREEETGRAEAGGLDRWQVNGEGQTASHLRWVLAHAGLWEGCQAREQPARAGQGRGGQGQGTGPGSV